MLYFIHGTRPRSLELPISLQRSTAASHRYRTYPAIFNLADFGSPRVRQRAKMFLDLAMLEGEQLDIAGYRGGAKMRAKKDGGEAAIAQPDELM